MKLLFSEAKPEYQRYIFPYVIWAFPEAGETPADLFEAGFLPSSKALDRFYLNRHIRVDLRQFKLSSENRRILRKGEAFRVQLVPRAEFAYTPERREFCLRYAEQRLGQGVMTAARLDELFASPLATHLLVAQDAATGRDAGYAVLYVSPGRMAYYYFAYYDLELAAKNLGMFLMTSAVAHFAAAGSRHLYLGTCYSKKGLYKTQFGGCEFFNGVRWSANLDELKHLLARQEENPPGHLLEDPDYLSRFAAPLPHLSAASPFRVATSPPAD